MSAPSAAVVALLKELYPPNAKIADMAAKASPLFKKIKFNTELGGKNITYPILFENSIASSNYAQAWTDRTAPKQAQFVLTLPPPYLSPFGIQVQDILLGQNMDKAFVQTVKRYGDAARNACINAMCAGLWHTAAGEIGQVSSDTNVATTTVKLADKADIINIQVGQKLVAAATRTGSLRSSTELTVVSVDRSAGTMILSAAANTQSWVAGDFIFVKGSAYASNGNANPRPYGIPDYIPSTAPTAGDSFAGGCDRSVDSQRLSGIRVDGSSGSIESGLIDCLAQCRALGGEPDVLVMHQYQFAALVKQLGSRVQYYEDRKTAGTSMVTVTLGTSKLEVMEDQRCPTTKAYFLETDSFEFYAPSDVPALWDKFGGVHWLPSTTVDEVLCAFRADVILACYAPGHNGVVTLPAL